MKLHSQPPSFYGHIIVLVAFFIQVIGWGINNSFGVFFNPLLNEFGWTRATLSGAVSMGFFVYGLFSIFIGGLSDRFGPRPVMTCCGIFLGIGYLLMSQVSAVWHIYLFFGIIIGMGQSGMDVIPLSTVARWYVRKRSTMSGIIKVGTGVGMVISPVFVTWLITTKGWRVSFFVLGLIILITIITLAQFLVRDPEKKGQLPDNAERDADTPASNMKEKGLSLKEVIRKPQFWIVCLIYFIILVCVYTVLMHIVQHAIDLGVTPANAASVLAAIGGASIAGRFVMGFAGDKIGNRRGLAICFTFLLIGMVCIQFARNLWMLYLFATIYGFAHGGFFALSSPLVAGLFGTKSHGTIFGIVIFAGTIGGAIGPVMAGYIFDVKNSYQIVFLILTALSFFGLLLSSTLKPVAGHTPA